MFAAAMDLVVASDDAKFLPALLQYFSIPWDMPPRKAKEILFQSRFVGAEEAQSLRFIWNMVVPRARLEEETMALADENRGERSFHAPDGEVGGEFGAGRDGIQHRDSQRSFASHGARNRRDN